jgi:hypothetical protein
VEPDHEERGGGCSHEDTVHYTVTSCFALLCTENCVRLASLFQGYTVYMVVPSVLWWDEIPYLRF